MATPYWNPYLETLPRPQLDSIGLRYFRRILSYAQRNSSMYMEKLKGVQPEAVRGRADLRALPLTEK